MFSMVIKQTPFLYSYICSDSIGHITLLKSLNRMPPNQGLCNKQLSGTKGKKVQLTFLLTTNRDGSAKLPPFIIGKTYRPHTFNNRTGAQLGFYYWNNAKAWMMASLYQEWLLDWDTKLRWEGQHILLLQDNFSGHVIPKGLTNMQIEILNQTWLHTSSP